LREAVAGERAEPTEAPGRADSELHPLALGWLELDLAAIPGRARVDPVAHPVEGSAVLRARKELAAEQLEAVQRVPAEVVLAPLEHGHAHLAGERRGGARHILGQELLLKRLGRGGDDDAPPGLERRDQVREALAGAR